MRACVRASRIERVRRRDLHESRLRVARQEKSRQDSKTRLKDRPEFSFKRCSFFRSPRYYECEAATQNASSCDSYRRPAYSIQKFVRTGRGRFSGQRGVQHVSGYRVSLLVLHRRGCAAQGEGKSPRSRSPQSDGAWITVFGCTPCSILTTRTAKSKRSRARALGQ